jgi:hypothetical protein
VLVCLSVCLLSVCLSVWLVGWLVGFSTFLALATGTNFWLLVHDSSHALALPFATKMRPRMIDITTPLEIKWGIDIEELDASTPSASASAHASNGSASATASLRSSTEAATPPRRTVRPDHVVVAVDSRARKRIFSDSSSRSLDKRQHADDEYYEAADKMKEELNGSNEPIHIPIPGVRINASYDQLFRAGERYEQPPSYIHYTEPTAAELEDVVEYCLDDCDDDFLMELNRGKPVAERLSEDKFEQAIDLFEKEAFRLRHVVNDEITTEDDLPLLQMARTNSTSSGTTSTTSTTTSSSCTTTTNRTIDSPTTLAPVSALPIPSPTTTTATATTTASKTTITKKSKKQQQQQQQQPEQQPERQLEQSQPEQSRQKKPCTTTTTTTTAIATAVVTASTPPIIDLAITPPTSVTTTANNNATTAANGGGGGGGGDDDDCCAICNDPDYSEADNIVFCDGCNVAVHQSCYGVDVIPSGSWFCSVCQDARNKHKKFKDKLTVCSCASDDANQHRCVVHYNSVSFILSE